MSQYHHKPVAVQAFQWTGQTQDEWPEWLQSYTSEGMFGATPVTMMMGVLTLPNSKLSSGRVPEGSWLVLSKYREEDGKFVGGELDVYRGDEFEDAFEVDE